MLAGSLLLFLDFLLEWWRSLAGLVKFYLREWSEKHVCFTVNVPRR